MPVATAILALKELLICHTAMGALARIPADELTTSTLAAVHRGAADAHTELSRLYAVSVDEVLKKYFGFQIGDQVRLEDLDAGSQQDLRVEDVFFVGNSLYLEGPVVTAEGASASQREHGCVYDDSECRTLRVTKLA